MYEHRYLRLLKRHPQLNSNSFLTLVQSIEPFLKKYKYNSISGKINQEHTNKLKINFQWHTIHHLILIMKLSQQGQNSLNMKNPYMKFLEEEKVPLNSISYILFYKQI